MFAGTPCNRSVSGESAVIENLGRPTPCVLNPASCRSRNRNSVPPENPNGAAAMNIAVAGFSEFLLTEAVSRDNNSDIFVELIQVVNQGSGLVIDNRDMVQLYR